MYLFSCSKLPLSIVLVGVGDGPWDTMREFDDNIPAREFDNFQFVNFTEIMSKHVDSSQKETEFALAALMEIPSQYKATIELKYWVDTQQPAQLHLLQLQLMIIRFVPFASLMRRTWPLVVVIRRAVNVEKAFSYVDLSKHNSNENKALLKQ
ncbi:hypothetical protein GH714_018457 [Hevea brasiliensis]|uniref:Copine C-terminal domain-containing protein n=1 Tax=Hevea brasiliensis TaxID=3981 RepID=A0A6A6KW80_HEVBR|nr:hypothetical protein GH714_018457 [Hevea brasiliensis]